MDIEKITIYKLRSDYRGTVAALFQKSLKVNQRWRDIITTTIKTVYKTLWDSILTHLKGF